MKYASFESETSVAERAPTTTTSATGRRELLQLGEPPHTRSTDCGRA